MRQVFGQILGCNHAPDRTTCETTVRGGLKPLGGGTGGGMPRDPPNPDANKAKLWSFLWGET